jgi:hypothetical protein
MKYQGELSIVGACGGYSKTPAKHAPAVGNSVLNSPINILGSGSVRIWIQVRLQGELCACGHEGCMCVSGLRIGWQTCGSLWTSTDLESA